MKTAFELEKEFVKNAQEKTGKSIGQWLKELSQTDLSKMKETIDFLKSEKGVSHMNAAFIAGIFLNDGKLVNDPEVLFNKHFEGKEDKRALYNQVEQMIMQAVGSVQVVPTKGYVSFRNPKEFAVAKINNKEIRIGLDLGDEAFNEYTTKAKSLGTMPRISHMVEIKEEKDINEKLKNELVRANTIVNN